MKEPLKKGSIRQIWKTYLWCNISISIFNLLLLIYYDTFNFRVGVLIFIRLCRCFMYNFHLFNFYDYFKFDVVYCFQLLSLLVVCFKRCLCIYLYMNVMLNLWLYIFFTFWFMLGSIFSISFFSSIEFTCVIHFYVCINNLDLIMYMNSSLFILCKLCCVWWMFCVFSFMYLFFLIMFLWIGVPFCSIAIY